ncbi:hypothetical protein FB451DRAFT_1412356 [Mycena latifolia]|nr:hypothetical protein FB451DRAFT_1412356 [Mycena latifolia]
MAVLSFAALPVALALLFIFPVHAAALTNLTIDDANSTYFTFAATATSRWAAISPGNPCAFCSAQPLTTDIHDQTWHDGSNGSSGTLTFQGTEVFLYGIDLANPANITFTLDGAEAAFHYYAGSEQFVFNSLFFHAGSLSRDANHTLTWTLHETKENGTSALFDYAVITVADAAASASASQTASSTPHSKTHTKVVAGAVVAVLGALLVAGVLFFLLRRRRKARMNALADAEKPRATRVRANYVQPFIATAPTLPASSDANGETSPVGSVTSPVQSKLFEARWNNVGQSTSTLPPSGAGDSSTELSAYSRAEPSADTRTLAGSQAETSTMASSARERFLEDRLAILEAHLTQHLPPPYESRE